MVSGFFFSCYCVFDPLQGCNLLIDQARAHGKQFKRHAIAPTYMIENSVFNGLLVLWHMFMTMMNVLNSYRMYRSNYVVATVLDHDMNSVSLPSYTYRNSECAPFIYGGWSVVYRLPQDMRGGSLDVSLICCFFIFLSLQACMRSSMKCPESARLALACTSGWPSLWPCSVSHFGCSFKLIPDRQSTCSSSRAKNLCCVASTWFFHFFM